MKKKIYTMALMPLLIAVSSITVLAASSDGEPQPSDLSNLPIPAPYYGEAPSGAVDSYIPSEYEQLNELNQRNSSLTEAQRAMIQQKLSETDSIADEYTASTQSTYTMLPGGYICYAQEQPAYCVAATCQAMMKYLTGTKYSQSVLANAMSIDPQRGGNFDNLRTYLNANQSKNAYVARKTNVSLETMKKNLYAAIATYKAPAALRIVCTTTGGWPYNSNGHALSVSSARDDKATFVLADPLIGYLTPGKSGYYEMSASKIHTAVTVNEYCGYIY